MKNMATTKNVYNSNSYFSKVSLLVFLFCIHHCDNNVVVVAFEGALKHNNIHQIIRTDYYNNRNYDVVPKWKEQQQKQQSMMMSISIPPDDEVKAISNLQQDNNINLHNTFTNRRNALLVSSKLVTSIPLLTFLSTSVASAAYIDPIIDMPIITKRVYMDILIPGDENPSRIIIGLFGNIVPRVVDNFIKLCDGIQITTKSDDNNPEQTLLSYAGTSFYRIISDVTIQGGAIGDITGKSGLSSYPNGISFEPDNYNIRHSKEGLISMVRNINGGIDSRFFFNTKDDAGWADDRYVAFGIIESGIDIIHTIEKLKVKRPQNNPIDPVMIVASGSIK